VNGRACLLDELVRLRIAVAVVVEPRSIVLGAWNVVAAEALRDRLLRIDVRGRGIHVDVEVAPLAWGIRAPRAEQHAGRNVADFEGDADLPPLVDQHLLDLLADLVTCGGRDLEAGTDTILPPDAVRAGHPTRLVQELFCLRRVVVVLM